MRSNCLIEGVLRNQLFLEQNDPVVAILGGKRKVCPSFPKCRVATVQIGLQLPRIDAHQELAASDTVALMDTDLENGSGRSRLCDGMTNRTQCSGKPQR